MAPTESSASAVARNASGDAVAWGCGRGLLRYRTTPVPAASRRTRPPMSTRTPLRFGAPAARSAESYAFVSNGGSDETSVSGAADELTLGGTGVRTETWVSARAQ